MDKTVFFNNVDDLVEYLLFVFGDLSPIKLQKSLYFLFAFYSGMYSSHEEQSGIVESNFSKMPDRLFDTRFEAWTYGPVAPEVYHKRKSGNYSPRDFSFDDSYEEMEIKQFIQDVGAQIMDKSDFALVDRSHEDSTWKNAIAIGNSTTMDLEDIENEYREVFNSK